MEAAYQAEKEKLRHDHNQEMEALERRFQADLDVTFHLGQKIGREMRDGGRLSGSEGDA